VILLGAVLIAVIPTIYHYIQSTVRARRAKTAVLDDAAAEALALKLDKPKASKPKPKPAD
jgi:hypothetical protein